MESRQTLHPKPYTLNPSKKKLLFIITQSEFGGAQRFLLELVTHLDPTKYECLVASQKGELLDTLKKKNIATRPLKWLRRDISPINDLLAVFEIRALLKQEKPDVLFLLSSKAGFLGSLATLRAHRLTRTGTQTVADKTLNPTPYTLNPRVVYRIGGWSFNDPQSWFSRKLFLWAEKISASWKDVIVVNSEHDRRQAEQFAIKPREKLVTIYNGIDVAKLDFYEKNEARTRLAQITPSLRHSSTQSPWIVCIANFYKTKGLPVLIEAMAEVHKKFPEVKLVIIGDGRERKNLESEIKQWKLGSGHFCPIGQKCPERHGEEVVVLQGHVKKAWRYLKAFDLFVLPSLKEGFPWVLLEAMAAEVPVIATRVGAVPEVITDGKNGRVVNPGDTTALQEPITELLQNPQPGTQFAARAKQTVEQKFRLDNMIKEVIEFL